MSRPKPYYLCTRPTLALNLHEMGKKTTLTENPFHPGLSAWYVDIDLDVCDIVAEFYLSIGKPVPRIIKEYAFQEGRTYDK